MALPNSWKYWVEVSGYGLGWVDFDGQPISRIVFSVVDSNLSSMSLPRTLVMANNLEIDALSLGVENFPANNFPRVPDFTFTLNCGWSTKSGTLSTVDALSALEQINAAHGVQFSLMGRKAVLVCGNFANSGMWYSSGWQCAFGPLVSTFPSPGANEVPYILATGVVSGVQRNGYDTVTISTTLPNEPATTGEAVSSDDGGAIKALVYSDGQTEARAELNAGALYFADLPDSFELLYVENSTGEKYSVDPASYTVSGDTVLLRSESGYITMYGGVSTPYSTEREIGISPLARTQTGTVDDKFQRFELVPVDATIRTGREICTGTLFLPVPEYLLPVSYQKAVAGRAVPNRNISGRGADGSPRFNESGYYKLFPVSNSYSGKYQLNIKQEVLSDGAYSIAAPHDTAFMQCHGAAGDVTSFNARSALGTYDYEWSETLGRYAPLTIFAFGAQNEYLSFDPSGGQLVVRFPSMEKVKGKVKTAKLYTRFRWCDHVRNGKTTVVKAYVKGDETGTLIADHVNTSGAIRKYNTGVNYDTPFTLSNAIGKDVANLSEVAIDVQFDWMNLDYPTEVYGNFALWACKLVVEFEQTVEDGDYFAISAASQSGAVPSDAIADLLGKFSPSDIVTDSATSGYSPIDAVINNSEPLRDSLRDILLASGMTMRQDLSYVDEQNVGYTCGSVSTLLAASPVTITEANIFSDGMPEAECQTADLGDIYNSFLVRFDYDIVTKKFAKSIYVDKIGYKFSGFSGTIGSAVPKCASAEAIIGTAKRTMKIDLRFGTEAGAAALVERLAFFKCWPCRTAKVSAATSMIPSISMLSRVDFSGARLPYYITSLQWICVGLSHAPGECTTDITLLELPSWT